MKKILLIACLVAFVSTTFSQPVLVNRNQSASFIKKVHTTSNTATQIDAVAIDSNEGGHIVVQVVGYSVDSAAIVTGTRTYRYTKSAGTLTLGTAIETVAIVADSKVSGSTFAASAVSNNIVIKVTGPASIPMYWTAVVKQFGYKKE